MTDLRKSRAALAPLGVDIKDDFTIAIPKGKGHINPLGQEVAINVSMVAPSDLPKMVLNAAISEAFAAGFLSDELPE